jgi:hypothetical protein
LPVTLTWSVPFRTPVIATTSPHIHWIDTHHDRIQYITGFLRILRRQGCPEREIYLKCHHDIGRSKRASILYFHYHAGHTGKQAFDLPEGALETRCSARGRPRCTKTKGIAEADPATVSKGRLGFTFGSKLILSQDNLAADVRVETERRLKSLQADLEHAEAANKERAVAVRYHKVKFFGES